MVPAGPWQIVRHEGGDISLVGTFRGSAVVVDCVMERLGRLTEILKVAEKLSIEAKGADEDVTMEMMDLIVKLEEFSEFQERRVKALLA